MTRTAAGLILALGIVCSAAPLWADEPWGLALMRPDSLAGWDHGSPAPSGWNMAAGKLTGKRGATPLVSGWTFGDVELRWEWSVKPGAALAVRLPEVPTGAGLEIRLAADGRCGELCDAEKVTAPGTAMSAGRHTAVLRRAQGQLALSINGKPAWQIDLPPARRFGLGLAMLEGEATIGGLRALEPAGKPLGNGRDLSDWWTPGDITAWAARDGEIAWTKRGGNYLRSKRDYGNFTFSCEYKIAKGGNSGVGIRTPRDGWPSSDGMEMQTWDKPHDTPLDKHQTMAIYGNVPPLARNDHSEVWNRVVIKADGYMISAWVNGELVQQYNTLHHPELKYRNLKGWVGVQDHTDFVAFRDLRLLEAPDGLGLAAWHAPRPRLATTVIVDRLMNPETLSRCDGITAGVVTRTIVVAPKPHGTPPAPEKKTSPAPVRLTALAVEPKQPPAPPKPDPGASPAKAENQVAPKPKAEAKVAPTRRPAAAKPSAAGAKKGKKPKGAKKVQAPAKGVPFKELARKESDELLAELSGPGAVVRIVRDGGDDPLAFYFDGEAKPRLECKLSELERLGSGLAEDVNPALVCLAYERSLKIVARRPAAGQYRIESLRFPPDTRVETYKGPESGFPRGWLSAVHYRYYQHKGGRVRDFDPAPRYGFDPQTLAPGQERAVEVPGVGIVQWTQLVAGQKVLQNNDLWLEVSVDGQKPPAVSTPARFWLPALAGGGNYPNFVLADRAGRMSNRLAMPFGKGIRLALVNRGAKPIEAVGLAVSVLRPTKENAKEVAQRMRLHAVYAPVEDGPGDLLNLHGAGRWVGLVYREAQGGKTGIDSFQVDGAERPEWRWATLDPLWGAGGPEFRTALTGRRGDLAWSYMLLAPVDFGQSLKVTAQAKRLGDRLVLYYAK